MLSPLKDHTLRIGSDLSKSLIEILKNVVDVFDTDGQPDQFRRQSRVTLLFFAELRVTCARWMERKALGIAHVGEMRKEAEFFDEPLASRLASLNPENDHAPEPVAQHHGKPRHGRDRRATDSGPTPLSGAA